MDTNMKRNEGYDVAHDVGHKMSIGEAFVSIYRNYANFKGRARRKIPLANFYLIGLFFLEGDIGANKYGVNPKFANVYKG